MKRFYKTSSVQPAQTGFAIQLDQRTIKSPQGNALIVPSKILAENIADEWAIQGEDILTHTMPLTGLVYAALDSAPHLPRLRAEALAYAKSDLLCYRAEAPDELVIRQAHSWSPLLDWLAQTHNARLKTTSGIAYIDQPPEALSALESHLGSLGPYHLAAIHHATGLSGSLVLALALAAGHLTAEQAHSLSRLDELYQAEKWGLDSEAETRAETHLHSLKAAESLLRHLKSA